MSTPTTEEQLAQALRELEALKALHSRESSSRVLAEEALDETQDRLALAVEAAQLALWEWDVASGKVFLAERWGAMLGEAPVAHTQTIDELLASVHPDDVAAVRTALDAALKGTAPRYAVEHRVRRDNANGGGPDWLWINSRGVVIARDAQGRATRMTGTNADITQRKAALEAVQRERDAAEAAGRAKSEFLLNMCRELHTPGNSIVGTTRLLVQAQAPASGSAAPASVAQQGAYVELLDGSVRVVHEVLNDVLDFATIDAGRLVLDDKAFQLEPWLEALVAPHAAAAREKGVNLVVRLEGRLPRSVTGDAVRLGQVLSNLLSNAVKFTQRGEVEVAVIERQARSGRCALRFEVTDTGAGIPLEKQARIFDAFTHTDAPAVRPLGGTGLGLVICDRLVRMMGGRIKVMSLPGRGSVFAFEAMFGMVGEDTLPASSMVPADLPLNGLRVLLAEDHEVNELMMRRMLSQMGCDISVARNGREAVEHWVRGGVDLVLMDVQMPEVGGVQATQRIRRQERATGRARRTPIIAVTGSAMDADREACLAAGMDAYLAKPVSAPELMRAIQQALRGNPASPAAGPAAAQPMAPAPIAALDADKLLERLGGDRAALDEVAQAMRDDMSTRLPLLAEALAKRDSAATRAQVHALKGSLSTLTASRAAALAKGLENAARQNAWELFERAMPVFRNELARVDDALAKLLAA